LADNGTAKETPRGERNKGGFGLRRWMIVLSLIILAVVLLDAGIGIWKLLST